MALELQLMDLDLAIAKLAEDDGLDGLISRAKFASITKSDEEISLVIDMDHLPNLKYVNRGWKAFKIAGPLDFSLVGILERIIRPLSENGISIFTISTFDTDYILVKREQVENAVEVLGKTFKVYRCGA